LFVIDTSEMESAKTKIFMYEHLRLDA